MKSIWAINKILVLASFIFLLSCNKENDNSLTKEKEIEGIAYKVDYLPNYKDQAYSIDSIKLADLDYYKFTIQELKGSERVRKLFSPKNYNNLLYYVNKNIESDFKIIYNEKEITPVQVYFESNNRLADKITFLVAFEKNTTSCEEIGIVFNDNIFNNGLIKFNYKISDLNKL